MQRWKINIEHEVREEERKRVIFLPHTKNVRRREIEKCKKKRKTILCPKYCQNSGKIKKKNLN